MDQLTIFDDEDIIIPAHVKAPFECNKKLGSFKFVANKRLFTEYVNMIQRQGMCTFLEARMIFFEVRDTFELAESISLS